MNFTAKLCFKNTGENTRELRTNFIKNILEQTLKHETSGKGVETGRND